MEEALREARVAGAQGEVPIGAVLVRDGVLLARAGNASIAEADPTGHAEVRALRSAARADPKAGAAGSLFDLAGDQRLNHRMVVDAGVAEDECRAVVQGFFRARRERAP